MTKFANDQSVGAACRGGSAQFQPGRRSLTDSFGTFGFRILNLFGISTFGFRISLAALLAFSALLLCPRPAHAYVEAAYSLGRIINESTNVLLVRVESVDRQKNTIIYSKVRDLKGTHNGATVKHMIGQNGYNPREWQSIMAWAEVGKTAVVFHNGSQSRDVHRQLLVPVRRRATGGP